ncbi:hypothetical protein A5698_27450 [Mycobacterium sp. E136]|nr:hypothetical protein A5698_27450 [Mycobacterium sp. E136]
MDPPTRPRAQIFVVVAQVPYEIRGLTVADRPVMGDAGDSAERIVTFVGGGVDLADDRVFGPGHGAQRSHRRTDTLAAVVAAHGLQRSWRLG